MNTPVYKLSDYTVGKDYYFPTMQKGRITTLIHKSTDTIVFQKFGRVSKYVMLQSYAYNKHLVMPVIEK
jgi:hypothetical protein